MYWLNIRVYTQHPNFQTSPYVVIHDRQVAQNSSIVQYVVTCIQANVQSDRYVQSLNATSVINYLITITY